MISIVFATGNAHKIKEVKELLDDSFRILNLEDIGCHEDIPETMPTIEGNALQKARYVRDNYSVDCFAEDTGLLVDALDGAPGVVSARYAGPARDANANMALLLNRLGKTKDRQAHFKTVIALILEGKEYTFEGTVHGHIAWQASGTGGFGYDPIFIPENYQRSFAEMTAEEKNAVSHRARALAKLKSFLTK